MPTGRSTSWRRMTPCRLSHCSARWSLLESPQDAAGRRSADDPADRRDGSEQLAGSPAVRTCYWQNETTDTKPALVDTRTFNELLTSRRSQLDNARTVAAVARVAPGYRVELAAVEPLVEDPVSFAYWGTDGGACGSSRWGTTRTALIEPGKPGGCVRRLVDRDGDGRYDEANSFLRRPSFPDRRPAVAKPSPGDRGGGPDLRRGHRRRRQGGPAKAAHHRVHLGNQQHRVTTGWYGDSTTGSTRPTATAAAQSGRS